MTAGTNVSPGVLLIIRGMIRTKVQLLKTKPPAVNPRIFQKFLSQCMAPGSFFNIKRAQIRQQVGPIHEVIIDKPATANNLIIFVKNQIPLGQRKQTIHLPVVHMSDYT